MTTKQLVSEKPLSTTPAVKADTQGYQIGANDWGFTNGATNSQVKAALVTRSVQTAATIKAFACSGEVVEFTDLMGELRKAGDEVVGGDLGRVERLLTNQVLTLDAIFNNLAQRAAKQDNLKGLDVLLRLSLKAQAQVRSTAETLALLKNPQPYIRQANVTTGPQQVNNTYAGTTVRNGSPSGAEEFKSEPIKLLEPNHDK